MTPLPLSEPSVLITLTRVTAPTATAAGGSAPVARSYDGHPWEALAAAPLPLLANATLVDIPSTPDGTAYTLKLYNATELASAAAPPSSQGRRMGEEAGEWDGAAMELERWAAARLLLQATLGPTRAELDGPLGTNASKTQAVREWLHAQVATGGGSKPQTRLTGPAILDWPCSHLLLSTPRLGPCTLRCRSRPRSRESTGGDGSTPG